LLKKGCWGTEKVCRQWEPKGPEPKTAEKKKKGKKGPGGATDKWGGADLGKDK